MYLFVIELGTENHFIILKIVVISDRFSDWKFSS